MTLNRGPVRELTYDQRATWGTCPTCRAEHGQPCRAEYGVHIGRRADGRLLTTGEGVHLGRLEAAPFRVREVPA